ncbi:MAG: PAS domain S-box protein [Symploca sp. SIO3C6]|nr:PAS domain S-box protein [Symploca sp. SIO3C6]
MSLQASPISSEALEAAIDSHPLKVTAETCLSDIIHLICQLGSSCKLSQGVVVESFPHQSPAQTLPAKSIENNRVSSCVLVMAGTKLLGLLTEHDLVKVAASGMKLEAVKVAAIMTSTVITLRKSDLQDVFAVLKLFRQHRIRHLPILDDCDQLLGIVTLDSITRLLQPAEILKMLKVAQVMTTQLLYTAPTTSLLDIAKLMVEHQVSCIAIAEEAAPKAIAQPKDYQQQSLVLKPTNYHHPQLESLSHHTNLTLTSEQLVPMGIVTEQDLVQFQALELDWQRLEAQTLIHSPLSCLSPQDSLWTAHQQMQQQHVEQLLVSGVEGELIGLISQNSLLGTFYPSQMYHLIQTLQQKFEQLQAEKISIEQSALLQQAQIELSQRQRTELLQKANQALSSSIATNRALLKAIPDSILRISRDGTLVNYKTAKDGSMPLLVKQFLGKHLTQILPAEVAKPAMDCVECALKTSEIQTLEYQLSLNGSIHDYEARFAVSDAEEVMVIVRDITERNQALAALQQQLAAVEASIDGIAIVNKEGKYIYINKSHVQLFGYHSAQELIGKSWSELYYQEEIHRFKCEILPILEQEGRWRGEVIAKRLDGSTFAEEISLTLTVEGSLVCICRDITERKQAEAALRASEERFRATFEQAAVGIAHTGFDGKFLRLNQKCCDIVGYSYEQMLTKSFVDITHPDDVDVDQRYVEQLLAGEINTFSMEKRYYRQDKSIVWVNLTGSLVRKPSGELDYFVGVIEDISDRKRAEAALQDSEQKYRSVVESVKEVIFQTDIKGLWTFLNPAWTEITGFSIEDSLGKNFVDYIHPDDRKQCLELWHKLITGQQEYCRHEIRYLTKDNSLRWIDALARLVVDAKGNTIGISGTLHDFTKRKQAQEKLRKALEQEKELSELKSRFVSMTSHEFRTPLTTILGSTELLRYYSHKWSEQKKILHYDRIQANVQHMTKMLDDVLLLGKAEAGKLEFKPVALDIVNFCRSLVEESQLSLGGKHQIVFLYKDQGLDIQNTTVAATVQLANYAHLDEKLLRHILSNLLSNAIKYSPIDSTIKFELFLQEKEVIFQIKDQGIGIPPEDQQHLFKSFHRAQNVGKVTGTGLGLAIVKKSVDLHDGKIKVDSQVGVGTTFTVNLPRGKEYL